MTSLITFTLHVVAILLRAIASFRTASRRVLPARFFPPTSFRALHPAPDRSTEALRMHAECGKFTSRSVQGSEPVLIGLPGRRPVRLARECLQSDAPTHGNAHLIHERFLFSPTFRSHGMERHPGTPPGSCLPCIAEAVNPQYSTYIRIVDALQGLSDTDKGCAIFVDGAYGRHSMFRPVRASSGSAPQCPLHPSAAPPASRYRYCHNGRDRGSRA